MHYEQPKEKEINLILDDFNAKVECEVIKGVVEKYILMDLGDRNDRKDMLQFCSKKDFVIKNVYYNLSSHKVYI